MKNTLCLSAVVLVALTLGSAALAKSGAGPEGRWLSPDNDATIEVYAKDGALHGKLVAADDPKAPLGVHVLRDFRPKGDKWVGKLYVIKKKRTVDADMKLVKGKLQLKVKAGVFSKTLHWTRAK